MDNPCEVHRLFSGCFDCKMDTGVAAFIAEIKMIRTDIEATRQEIAAISRKFDTLGRRGDTIGAAARFGKNHPL